MGKTSVQHQAQKWVSINVGVAEGALWDSSLKATIRQSASSRLPFPYLALTASPPASLA